MSPSLSLWQQASIMYVLLSDVAILSSTEWMLMSLSQAHLKVYLHKNFWVICRSIHISFSGGRRNSQASERFPWGILLLFQPDINLSVSEWGIATIVSFIVPPQKAETSAYVNPEHPACELIKQFGTETVPAWHLLP